MKISFKNIRHYKNLIKCIIKARGSAHDTAGTVIINAVIQSGMSMLLFSLKDHFDSFIIVGHPSTLFYCMNVFTPTQYRERVRYKKKIDFGKYKRATIIADSQDKECDIWVDFDYYNRNKRKVADMILPYYRSPARFYYDYVESSVNFKPRKCTVFFGGAIPLSGYPSLEQAFPGLMNRAEIVDCIKRHFDNRVYLVVKDERLGDTEYKIRFEDFENQLATSDFFVAPPGIGMPHCHNVIEALSKGTIPIINYSSWFSPELENGVNCLTFSDERSLIESINVALKMPELKIHEMRENVKAYYDTYCSENAVYNMLKAYFAKRKRAMMLVNDEGNTIAKRKEENGFSA